MSDVMLFGVLRMPYDMAMATETSRHQYWQRGKEAADRIEILERELAEERNSREVAADKAWAFAGALRKIIEEDLQTTRHKDGTGGETVYDGYFGGIARAALEDKA